MSSRACRRRCQPPRTLAQITKKRFVSIGAALIIAALGLTALFRLLHTVRPHEIRHAFDALSAGQIGVDFDFKVNDKTDHPGMVFGAMQGVGDLEKLQSMAKQVAPMGEIGLKLFQQFMDVGNSSAAKKKKDGEG